MTNQKTTSRHLADLLGVLLRLRPSHQRGGRPQLGQYEDLHKEIIHGARLATDEFIRGLCDFLNQYTDQILKPFVFDQRNFLILSGTHARQMNQVIQMHEHDHRHEYTIPGEYAHVLANDFRLLFVERNNVGLPEHDLDRQEELLNVVGNPSLMSGMAIDILRSQIELLDHMSGLTMSLQDGASGLSGPMSIEYGKVTYRPLD